MRLPQVTVRAGLVVVAAIAASGCTRPPQDERVERAGSAPSEFAIDGRIEGLDSGEVTLLRDGAYVGFTYEEAGSVEIRGGRFSFTGPLEAPEMVHLRVEGGDGEAPSVPVFLEPGEVEVVLHADDWERVEVSGSSAQRLFARFTQEHARYLRRIEQLSGQLEAARQSGDAAAMLRLEEEREVVQRAEEAFVDGWIAAHADSSVAPWVAVRHRIGSLDMARIGPLLDLFPDEISASRYVQELGRRRELLARVAVGETVPDFELPTAAGEPAAIGDFRGKVTLIDFWGAWCGPCRAQNPALVELYESFGRDDFEIVGVSIDFSRDAWLGAIEADGLPWTQMGDVSGFDTGPAQIFAVRSLPSNVLLGRDGTILAKDLEVDRLPEVIASLIG